MSIVCWCFMAISLILPWLLTYRHSLYKKFNLKIFTDHGNNKKFCVNFFCHLTTNVGSFYNENISLSSPFWMQEQFIVMEHFMVKAANQLLLLIFSVLERKWTSSLVTGMFLGWCTAVPMKKLGCRVLVSHDLDTCNVNLQSISIIV